MSNIVHKTWSLCPDCLTRLPATIVQREDDVFLEKTCPNHGTFSTPIWRGTPAFTGWSRPKTPYLGGVRLEGQKGCPYDCGLCQNHNQRTCTALVELTERCNLGCPVCFASSETCANACANEPDLKELEKIFTTIYKQTGGCNLQLSGGEPSLRNDLPEIIQLARKCGFTFVQLNSNGIRLAQEPEFVEKLADAGLSSVFLQFDGLDDDVYRVIRGRKLFETKKLAIKNISKTEIGIVLVPTLVAGINTEQVWDIVQFGLDHAPHVRGVHFQPVSFFGRYPEEFVPRHVTLPEIMTALSTQSAEKVTVADFVPPGCEHSLCSFSAKYLQQEDGRLKRLGSTSCDCKPQPALQGAIQSIAQTARQWSGTPKTNEPTRQTSQSHKKPQNDLDAFLARAQSHSFSISAMAFQDCWNIDLERVRACCIHVATRDGRLIPFCSYNLTSRQGASLYRPRGKRYVQQHVESVVGKKMVHRDELLAYQLSELKKTLSYTMENSPFYKQKWQNLDSHTIQSLDDLSQLGFTDADDIKKAPLDFLCCSQSKVEHIITMHSSGSTGKPKRFFYTQNDLHLTKAFFKTAIQDLVGSEDNLLILLPGELPASVGALLQDALCDTTKNVEYLWPPTNMEKVARHIEKGNFTSLVGLPQHLLELSYHLKKVQIRTMLLCSDYASPSLRNKITENCGANTFLHYGSSESGLGGAVECLLHQGAHIRESDLIVEVIDPTSLEVLPEGSTGELVITTLHREAMPLIRYRTGDIGAIDRKPCACGDITARIIGLEGRADSVLLGKTTYSRRHLDDCLFTIDGLVDYRLFIEKVHERNNVSTVSTINTDFISIRNDIRQEVHASLNSFFGTEITQGSVIINIPQALDAFTPDHKAKRTFSDLRQ